jgi:predicted lipid-binding transport protein (Tim44 family)
VSAKALFPLATPVPEAIPLLRISPLSVDAIEYNQLPARRVLNQLIMNSTMGGGYTPRNKHPTNYNPQQPANYHAPPPHQPTNYNSPHQPNSYNPPQHSASNYVNPQASAYADSLMSMAGVQRSGHDPNMSDSRAKTILKEAVDAVVNSFAKHTHGYGRGKGNI